jgi:stage II sporulation protein R
MKKALPVTALVILILVAMSFSAYAEKLDAVRLHVVANSDSDFDQTLKLKVRDALLEQMTPCFENVSSPDEAELILLENGRELNACINEVLAEAGVDYGATLEFGNFYFPDRDYDGSIYPAGYYDALRVVLGKGEGHNWWCVMFPPLCLVDFSDDYEYTGDVRFESLFAELFAKWMGAGQGAIK